MPCQRLELIVSHFNLFGRAITLERTRLTAEDGTLAGAHLDMMGAVRGAVSLMRVSLEDALVMASRTPARFLGLDGMLGTIRKDYRADLVAFDASFIVTDTWVAGDAGHVMDEPRPPVSVMNCRIGLPRQIYQGNKRVALGRVLNKTAHLPYRPHFP